MTPVVYVQSCSCLVTSDGICTSVRPNMYGRYLRLSELITHKGPSALAAAPRYNITESPLVWYGVLHRWVYLRFNQEVKNTTQNHS